MPPKKDMEETSDEEEVEGEDEGEAGEGDEDPDSNVKKRLLSAQMTERVAALSDKCKLLTAENEKLTEEVVEAKSSLKDISEVLTADVKAKTEQVGVLERQLAEAVQEADRARAALERALAEERAAFKKEVTELRTRTEEAENKLRDVRDFAERKGHLDDQLAQARAELARDRKEHEDKLGELERHAVQDKDKLRKEAAIKVKEARTAMMALTESQLDTATKATIQENEAMSGELRYTAKRAEKLLLQAEKLTADNAALKRELHISKTVEAELARKSCLAMKTVQLLTGKVEGQAAVQREDDAERAELRQENEALRGRVNSLQGQLEAAHKDVDRFKRLSEAQAAELEAGAAYEDEAVHFLRACLADVREQIVAVTAAPEGGPGDDSPAVGQGGLDQLALYQRQQALEYLFKKLAAYQAVKRGSWSQAPFVQYSFASPRTAGPTSSLQTDLSISELLALSTPLTPGAAGVLSGAGANFGKKEAPASEVASQPHRAMEPCAKPSRFGSSRDQNGSHSALGSVLASVTGSGRSSAARTAGIGGLRAET